MPQRLLAGVVDDLAKDGGKPGLGFDLDPRRLEGQVSDQRGALLLGGRDHRLRGVCRREEQRALPVRPGLAEDQMAGALEQSKELARIVDGRGVVEHLEMLPRLAGTYRKRALLFAAA